MDAGRSALERQLSSLDAPAKVKYEISMRTSRPTKMAVAKLADPFTGFVERELLSENWPVPRGLRVYGDNLSYLPGTVARRAKAESRLLLKFIELEDAEDTSILDFARRYGILHLCEQEGLPVGHATARPIQNFCAPKGWPDECAEALADWRAWARRGGAALRLAAAIHDGQEGEFEDWMAVAPGSVVEIEGKTIEMRPGVLRVDREFVRGRWDALALIISAWVDAAALRPRCIAVGHSIETKLAAPNPYSGLFAVISSQILFAAAKANRLYSCSACGRLYIPKHKPTFGRDTYCPQCGIRAAWRAASARLYAKRKSGRVRGKTVS